MTAYPNFVLPLIGWVTLVLSQPEEGIFHPPPPPTTFHVYISKEFGVIANHNTTKYRPIGLQSQFLLLSLLTTQLLYIFYKNHMVEII